MASIRNIITFRNLTYGAKVFGESGPVKNFEFVDNIAFQNDSITQAQLEGVSGSSFTSNIWFTGNTIMGRMNLSYVSTGNKKQFVHNNVIVRGSLLTQNHQDSEYTNNVIFMRQAGSQPANTLEENGYRTTLLTAASLNVTWDYNQWYTLNGTATDFLYFQTSDVNSGWVNFAGWQAASGFDPNGSVTIGWPNDYLYVTAQQSDYDTNRWHIAVVSTSGQTSTTLNLSSLGFTGGQRYRLRDAQNYFVPIAYTTYQGGTITLPLNLTNVSTINGTMANLVNEHTNVDNPGLFNAFVLERMPGGKPVKSRRNFNRFGL